MTTTPTPPLRYVYAVCRPFGGVLPEGAAGITGEPPRLLHHDGLVAVVDAVPAEEFDEGPLRARLEDLDWLSATARGHDAVVASLTAVTSPLPLRLATVCRDDSGVRRLLDEGRDRFVRALERLDGRVEWGVKVHARKEATAGPRTPAGSPSGAVGGREYLRRRLRERDGREEARRRAEAVGRELHARLSAYAEATAVHPPQDSRLTGDADAVNVLNAAYLVPRERAEGFVALVGEVADSDGVRVELTGPWAAYSFAGIAEAAEPGTGTAGPEPSGPAPEASGAASGPGGAREGAA
ncbi:MULTISPECIES: GvpL/GvpF family gas vesicle protein [Streptomyces]|uniref:Gas vesicle synthesis protein GvpL/GvpF n=1 Tax=Streptomyces rubrolavendulae TaxID=285473 RepID=A0A1D8FVV7_9ACTN|nr:GvpL/GvpF family gas vesicle protein [Streptomyces rubrolavendulae]AOT57318.1 Gas vesicle synthesis protein GvpL/GvpF [Streptomyces rubrolavendulae]